jgi:hypothetical protein
VADLDLIDDLSPESAARLLRFVRLARRDLERLESKVLDVVSRRRTAD